MSAYVIFYAFFAAGVIRAVAQRHPRLGDQGDEEETVDITVFGGEVRSLDVGLDRAVSRARGLYVDDEITVEDYEAELDRLIAEGARLR